MIVATNTIRIQAGRLDEVAERFKNPQGVQHAPGFVRMELLASRKDEFDELKVCTTWENREAYDGWVNSDAFKMAHSRARPQGASAGAAEQGAPPQAKPASVMLGAELSVHEIVFSTEG